MARLSLFLLGRFGVERDGRPVTRFDSDRARALLVYLAVESHRPHTRDELTNLMWSHQPEHTGRASLRDALRKLRKALDDHAASTPFVLADHQIIQLNPTSDAWLDAKAFTSLLAECDAHHHLPGELCTTCAENLAQAIALYGGDFLAGFSLPESEPFEAWVRATQERLHRQALYALDRLTVYHEAHGNYSEAIRFAQRQIELEPWREEAHVQLMRSLTFNGQRSTALAQYETCRRILAQELHAEPAVETTALRNQILAGVIGDMGAGEIRLHTAAPLPTRSSTPLHNLPARRNSLVGRKSEITNIKRALKQSRLVTLTGPGGVGKTHLAIRAATELVDRYADGVWLVELAAVSNPDLVSQTVAAALGLRGAQGPQALVNHLHDRRALLVLDNCEHLIAACAELAEQVLDACPDVRILATSREALRIPGEQVWPAPQLSLPEALAPASPEALMQYDGIRLFVERARATQPRFVLTSQNAEAVVQVCQRLDGLPLALELAAARMNTLTVAELAARLNDCFALLTAGSRTALPRQHTLRATLDWSYDLLSEPEQALFRQLSTFVGGFTLHAAEAVAGMGAFDLLSQLVGKSLVTADAHGDMTRYSMLEMIREYAHQKLVEAGEAEAACKRHLECFVKLAADNEPNMRNSGEAKALQTERDNLCAAIEGSLASDDPTGALQLAGSLSWFWWMRGYLGQRVERLIEALARPEVQTQSMAAIRAKAMTAVAAMLLAQRRYGEGRRYLEDALAISTALGERRTEGLALRMLGPVVMGQGDSDAADAFLRRGAALWRELGDTWHVGWLLAYRGDVAVLQGEPERAHALYIESAETLTSKGARSYPLRRLGYLASIAGDYDQARALMMESLAFNVEAGDKQGVGACLAGLAGVCIAEAQSVAPVMQSPNAAFSHEARRRRDRFLHRAAQLFGLMEATLATVGAPLLSLDKIECERNMTAVRAQLGDAVFQAEQAAGKARSLDQVIRAFTPVETAAISGRFVVQRANLGPGIRSRHGRKRVTEQPSSE